MIPLTEWALTIATFVQLGLVRTVVHAGKSLEPGALSAVAGLATREELVKALVSDVLREFAMKGRCENVGEDGFKCICPAGYSGERCEEGVW